MKKTTLFIAFALLVCGSLSAQQPDFLFEQSYPYTLLHTLFWEEAPEAMHLEKVANGNSEGYYLVAVSDMKNSTYYESDGTAFPSIIYKVSMQGEILGATELGFGDRYSRLYGLFDDPKDSLCSLAIGTAHDNDAHYDRPFMAKFDQDLNLLWQREIELPEAYHANLLLAAIVDSYGDIVCSLGVAGISSPVFCRLTAEGELVTIKPYPGQCDFFINTCGGLFEFRDGGGNYGKIIEVFNTSQTTYHLVRFDRDMELVGDPIVPSEIRDEENRTQISVSFITNCISLADGSVILGNDAQMFRYDSQYYSSTYDNVICFMKVDQDGNLVSYVYVGEGEMGVGNDSIKTMQTALRSIDMVGDNAFYFQYGVGQPHGMGYDYLNCFVVTKMDVDGNVIWRRYWDRYDMEHDMKVYYPSFLTTTTDEGCLVSGYCYYSDIYGAGRYGSQPEVFMLKFFADGSLSLPESQVHVRPFMFYPNPAHDALRLQYSPDATPTLIELYDLQGRLVRSQRNGWETVDMEGLAAGVYTMRITLEDGNVFSEKVVKE